MMEDDFALRYARIYPGVNSRAELVTLAPGLTPGTALRAVGSGISIGVQLYTERVRGNNKYK